MLINSLGLRNFKCFEELDVKFAPITLLTGANSSGKSSLINAILAVLQTGKFPFYLSPNGKYVNMGSFEEMAKRGTKDFTLDIDLNLINYYNDEIDERYVFDTKWREDHSNNLPTALKIQFKSTPVSRNGYNFNLKNTKNGYIFDYEMNIFFDDKLHTAYYEHFKNHDLLKDYIYSDKHKLGFKNVPIDTISQFMSTVINNGSLFSIFSNYDLEHSQINEAFNYISSFRSAPERTYYQKSKASDKVTVSGEGYIDQIVEWEDTSDDRFNQLIEIAKKLELLQDITSTKFKGGRFELNIKAHSNSQSASLTDVGFGISQFLPVVVADLQLGNESCLAVSQPEIHLHPKIQAAFSNYLANQIKNTQKQYIIETHSEYLLNRIRLLLVTGELKPEDVRVLYFENDGIKTTTHNIKFATDGSVKGAPESFFDTYGIDVMNIAMEAIK